MNERGRRLVLNYNPGVFSFRNFDVLATDTELYNLAVQINSVQEDAVYQIRKVRVLQLR
ncbi:MAG: hypothetical protein FWC92_06355 [Defluviitaleaceae bacterium]|nr:hypothetical protein [Defluviitaleaceae bacterium]